MDLRSACQKLFPERILRFDAPMSEYTTFRVGGPAQALVEPESEEQLRSCVLLCRENGWKLTVIGNGSNLLVNDAGLEGLTVRLNERFSGCGVEGETLSVKAGTSLAAAANTALKAGLTGLEFASGIPGSTGGGSAMNAGAYGGELKDVLVSCRVLDMESLKIEELSVSALEMGYRTTRMLKRGDIVTLSVFKLANGDSIEIKAQMDELNRRRREKQPLSFPSAGSTFKRPNGYFAGALIEQAGCKGLSIGGAQVSEKHAGFIINKGGASAKDILDLINEVQKRVFDMSGVRLEPEVRLL